MTRDESILPNNEDEKVEELLISVRDQVIKTVDDKYEFNGKDIEDTLDRPEETGPLEENELIEIKDKKLAEIINDFTGEQHENTIVLTGAGASILNIENKDEPVSKEKINHSGKTVRELTKEIDDYLKGEGKDTFTLEEFAKKIKYIEEEPEYDVNQINIEDLLSKAEFAREYIYKKDKNKFDKTLDKTERKIKELCDLILHPEHPHKHFLQKLTSRRSSHSRMKIFTTNYDTLFEQAAQKESFLIIDGFTYEFPRKFDPFMYNYDFVRRDENKVMDEPDYVEKVFHLYKLHGSVDWERKDNEITKKSIVDKPLMIYPRKDKFEQSYEPPYFEMFSRFQNELRKKNTLLITVGFSFADKHIHTIVENAVKNNPGLKLLIVDFNISQEGFKEFKEYIKDGYNNIMLFKGDFKEFTELYLKQRAYSDRFFENTGVQND